MPRRLGLSAVRKNVISLTGTNFASLILAEIRSIVQYRKSSPPARRRVFAHLRNGDHCKADCELRAQDWQCRAVTTARAGQSEDPLIASKQEVKKAVSTTYTVISYFEIMSLNVNFLAYSGF